MCRLLFISLSFLWSINVCKAQHPELRKEVDKIVFYDTEIDPLITPGFMLGIVDGQEQYFLDYGYTSLEKSDTLNQQSVFEIGSCTKLFTAAFIEDLVLQDVLSYDDLINSFLDQKYYNPHLADLTIADLVYHKSPLPKRPTMFGVKEQDTMNPYAYFTKEDLLTFYGQFTPKENFKGQYSHCNYALLELVLASVLDKNYEEVLKDYAQKWKLTYTQTMDNNLVCTGYDRAGRMTKPRTYASFAGSEGIKSNVEDLCRYAQLHWSKQRQHQALINTLVVRGPSTFDKKIKMAKAWHVIEKSNKPHIYVHTGTTSGHKTYIAMVPSTETAVVILSNSSVGTEDLAILVLRMINQEWKRESP